MKILIVPMVGGRGIGPICRSLAVANAAKDIFDIKFLCAPKFINHVVEAGFDYFLDLEPTKIYEQGAYIKWNDAAYAMGLCDETFVNNAFEHQMSIVKEYQPDIIFAEYNLTICMVAKTLGIPVVSTVHWADTASFSIGNYVIPNKFNHAIDPYNNILAAHNLDTYSDVATMATSIPILVAPTIVKLQPKLTNYNVEYVGELLNKRWETDVDIEKILPENIIYVYLATCDLPVEKWLNVILREFCETQYHIFLVANEKIRRYIETENIEFSENFHVNSFFPSLSIFKKSKLVIHAGSANIISGALLNGVPSLLIPLHDGERLYNALGVENNGAGEIITESEFVKEGNLYKLATKLINSSYYSSNAIKLGQEIEGLGGVNRVVGLLYDLSKERLLNEKS